MGKWAELAATQTETPEELPVEETGGKWSKLAAARKSSPIDKAPPVPDLVKMVPEWGRKSPNLYAGAMLGKEIGLGTAEAAVNVLPWLYPPLKAAGVGAQLVGGALNLAAGRQVNRLGGEAFAEVAGTPRPPPPAMFGKRTGIGPIDATGEAAIDVGIGLATGGAMVGGGKALGAAEDYLFTYLPKKLYSSAVKMPLTKKWVKVLPGHEVSQRTAAVEEGLRERVRPSEFGIAKAKSLEKEVRGYIDDVVDILSENPNNLIDRETVLKQGLEKAYKRADNSSDPEGARRIIGEFADKFREHPESITPSKANAIKRQLYDEVTWGAGEKTGLTGQISESSKKGVAHELMTSLEAEYPALESLNKTDAARINLIEALEKSTGRLENANIVPLGVRFFLSHPSTWPLAVWEATVGHPQVKTTLAFALAKANPEKFGKAMFPPKPEPWVPPPRPPRLPGFNTNRPLQTPQARQEFINNQMVMDAAPQVQAEMAAAREARIADIMAQREAGVIDAVQAKRLIAAEEGAIARQRLGPPVLRDKNESFRAPPPMPFGSAESAGIPPQAAGNINLTPSQLSLAKGIRTPSARTVAIQDIADEQAKLIPPVSERARVQGIAIPSAESPSASIPLTKQEIARLDELRQQEIYRSQRASLQARRPAPMGELLRDKNEVTKAPRPVPLSTKLLAGGAAAVGLDQIVNTKAVEADTGKTVMVEQTAQDALDDITGRRKSLDALLGKVQKSSLSKSLQESGLSESEKSLLRKDAADYRAENFSAQESNMKAVQDWLRDLDDEEADVMKQIGGE